MSLLGLIPATHLLAEASLLTFLTPLFSFCLCSGGSHREGCRGGGGGTDKWAKEAAELVLGNFLQKVGAGPLGTTWSASWAPRLVSLFC